MSIAALANAATAASPDAADAAKHRKLVDAAQQFEGIFLQEMLKPMTSMSKEDGDDDDKDGDQDGGDLGTFQSYGTEALAKSIAASGGLGIARQVIEEVEKTAKHNATEGTSKDTSAEESSKTLLKSKPTGPIVVSRRSQ